MRLINEQVLLDEPSNQIVAVALTTEQRAAFGCVLAPDCRIETPQGLLGRMPRCEEACRWLWGLGIDATKASPFMSADHKLVEGAYTPMEHQLYTAAFLTIHPRCYVLSDPRTGKTGSLILGLDYLQRVGHIVGGVLIMTTLTTLESVWYNSIKTTLPSSTIQVVNGKSRDDALKIPAEFYITNYDSVRLSEKSFIKACDEGRIGAVVIDELTHMGNLTSGRYKATDALVNKRQMKYVVGITGSPGSKPEPFYSMCKLVNSSKLPVRTKTAWMDKVTFRVGPESWQYRLRDSATETMAQAMQPAVRFKKTDIMDLPPVVFQDRFCPLSSDQLKLHKELLQEAAALLDSGEAITAVNGGVLLQKLLQIGQGFVTDTNGKQHSIEHKSRTQTIIDIIEETTNKVVIFGCYRYSNRMLIEELKSAGYTVGLVDGSITGSARTETIRQFQQESDPRVLVLHPTTSAFGIELSAADTMIFNGPPPLGEFIYAQALERLSSIKQTADSISVIHIFSSPEEKKLFRSLDNSMEISTILAGLLET